MSEVTRAEPQDERILILAPLRQDGPAVASVLRRAGLEPVLCDSIDALIGAFEQGAGGMLIAEEALVGPGHDAALSAALGRQPPWSELPLLLVSAVNGRRSIRTVVKRLAGYANVVLLERPLRSATLISALRAALVARRRQYQIRDHLRERERHAEQLRRLNLTLEERVVARTRELEEAMQRQREAERALRQAQKAEAIGQLTGGIAHDFNNLLMVCSAGLEMLERRPDEERRQRIVQGMRQAVARGEALTRQLLAFARRMTLTPEPVNLRNLIEGMRILVGGALRGDIEVTVDLDPALWPIMADPTQLELALLNLAINARDAMPEGGTLTLRAHNLAGHGDDFVCIEVSDTGTGIAPGILDRVFDPFFTTKSVGKGTGLGLSQVYGFASQSGGNARIESELGRGTTVILCLPRAEAAAVARQSTPSADREVPLADGDRTVLLVEDNEAVAEMAAEMLGSLGFRVKRASNAREALQALRADDAIDSLFSDVVMPGGMNGIELAREARRRRPSLPVILTSGYSDAARDLGPSHGLRLIQKPYHFETLKEVLRTELPVR